MGFHEQLERVRFDPAIRRLALQWARDPYLAEDALQETFWSVSRTKDPDRIIDVRAYFTTVLKRESTHQLKLASAAIPSEDIGETSDQELTTAPIGHGRPSDVAEEVCSGLTIAAMLARFQRERGQLMARVTGRSPDHQRYRAAIVAAAGKLLRLLLTGHVIRAEWNTVLKNEYPEYLGESGLARNAVDQRLSRARRDMLLLLRQIISIEELTS
jgi:DNA-directed RNA polymerase specialized sigma24 family protein